MENEVGFKTDLITRLKTSCDRIWCVIKPLEFWSKILNQLIVVPPWFESKEPDLSEDSVLFETDLASVPRIPFIYEAWGNRAHREAVLHDYLYRKDSVPIVTFSQANRVFLEALKSTKKPFYICYGMYFGVVLCGYSSYHKKYVKDSL